METKFEKINISKQEYMFFLTLPLQERLNYIFGLYESSAVTTVKAIDLSNFFSAIHETLDEKELEEKDHVQDIKDQPRSFDRVDVMIDDEIIMIEANSLRALRLVKNRFIEAGYILQRDVEQEKMFRKDKVTKYMRIFYIVDQITGICFN
jgi:hypothetical protein